MAEDPTSTPQAAGTPPPKKSTDSPYSAPYWARVRELWETGGKLSDARSAQQAADEFELAKAPHVTSVQERRKREGWVRGGSAPAEQPIGKEEATQERAPATLAPAPPAPLPVALSPEHERFVAEYMANPNATRAYLAVYPNVQTNTAATNGYRLLKNAEIQEALRFRRQEIADRLGLDAEQALAEAWKIVKADARELVERVVGCCRYCYGFGHLFQRTSSERERAYQKWQEDCDKATAADQPHPEWDEQGGVGFDERLDPHPDCPECFGRGHGRVLFKDTRSLSVAAQALYAGVKEGKEGLEVKMHSKMDALDKVFRHLGLYDADNRQREGEGNVIRSDMLDAIYAAGVEAMAGHVQKVAGRSERLAKLAEQAGSGEG